MVYEQAFGILVLGLKLSPTRQPVFADLVVFEEVQVTWPAEDGGLGHSPDVDPSDIGLLIRGQGRAAVRFINPGGVEIVMIRADRPSERLEVSGKETDRMGAVIGLVTVKGPY